MNFNEALKVLKEKELLIEMATIGNYSGHQISVYTEPLGNPSFHVKYKTEWEVVLSIKDFSILEVKYGKFKKGDKLPSYEMKSMMKFFELDFDELPNVSNWKFLLIQWNVLNPTYKINSDMKLTI